jgi:hypothetical protein
MKPYLLLILILYVVPIFKQSVNTIACKHPKWFKGKAINSPILPKRIITEFLK